MIDKQVEPDFADGNRALCVDLRAEIGQVFRPVHVEQHRMQPPRGQTAGIALAGCGHRSEVVAADGGNDQGGDAAGNCSRVNRIAVGSELGRVEMAVGVDKKRRRRVNGSGAQKRRHSGRRLVCC